MMQVEAVAVIAIPVQRNRIMRQKPIKHGVCINATKELLVHTFTKKKYLSYVLLINHFVM